MIEWRKILRQRQNYHAMNTQIIKGTPSSDEIDVVELIKTLWDKKWWIVLSTFVCTTLAGIYAFTAKEQWTSKAEIVGPRVGDLGDYFNVRREYARILNIDFDTGNLMSALYGKFERLAYSLDEREKFLEGSQLYKELSENLDSVAKRKLLNDLVRENINIIKPDAKKDPDAIGRKFTFSAETPELAQNTLREFVEFINQAAFKLDYDEFFIYANEKLIDLKFESEQIEQNLKIQKSVQLENLNKALTTAEKAGIKEYSKFLDDNSSSAVIQSLVVSDTKIPLSDSKLSDGVYVFMLGEKYLKAQIDAENKKNIIYPPRYYQIQEQLKELESILEKVKIAKANTFSYLSSPDYPVVKDKPKRLLILLIGIFLGLIISITLVLIISFLPVEHKVRNNAVSN